MREIICAVIMVIELSASASLGAGKKPDIDLSKFNAVMAYSGLFNVMSNPPAYEGKSSR